MLAQSKHILRDLIGTHIENRDDGESEASNIGNSIALNLCISELYLLGLVDFLSKHKMKEYVLNKLKYNAWSVTILYMFNSKC